jgi:hypothetical protein
MAAFAAASGSAWAAGPGRVSIPPMAQTSPAVNPLTSLGQIGNDTVTSTNWAGYAVQDASKFTDVKGTWVEPTATCSAYFTAQYAAFWAGIDGYSSDSVEQLGTDSDCLGHNRPSYYAWYEMYPADSVDLSTTQYPVKPGDTLSAEVSVSGSTFTLKMTSSEGWTFTTTQTGSGLAQSSAELIAESPEICGVFSCRLAELSNFGTVNFSGAEAAVSGGADQPMSAFTADSGPHDIIAETSGGVVRALPSPLSASGNAFSITWKHD